MKKKTDTKKDKGAKDKVQRWIDKVRRIQKKERIRNTKKVRVSK